MLSACRLAKLGYYGGDPEKVLYAPVNVIQALLDYEDFIKTYDKAYLLLNKKK